MIAPQWSIELNNNHIDIRAHGKPEATLKMQGLPAYPVHVSQSGNYNALPSIPVKDVAELTVRIENIKVVISIEGQSNGSEKQ